ncbi:ATPase [Maribacter cobaltidurans]|nr:ATPase [Maribacter cobaltidurans]
MVIAAIGAAAIGYWMDGAILIFIFSLSGTLEGYTMERTNKDIRSILDLRPEKAVLLRNGKQVEVKAEELKKGDTILIKPGERIAADGIITQGYSAIYQATITGESVPVDKTVNDEVFSGTVNGYGGIEVKVTKQAEETMLSKIIHLVQEAKNEKPPNQLFVEKFESIYAKIVVITAIILMIAPPFIIHWSWKETIYRAMIFLVVASPCALVSSIMPAILSAISNASRKRVLFKGGAHLENIAGVKAVIFDKTGTLTYGEPVVQDIISFENYSEMELLKTTASIEALSEHPIAKSIVQHALNKNIELEHSINLRSFKGMGVQGTLNGISYKVGKRDMLNNIVLTKEQEDLALKLEQQGRTIIFVSNGHNLIGMVSIFDQVRLEARRVIEELKNMNIRVALLTGDNERTAKNIGESTGIEEIYSGLLPEDKVDFIKKMTAKYGKVAMVGDGVNDAPALAAASVGIAMGAAGTDIAIETADVILMADDIERIPFAISLGKRTNRIIKQNVIFAIGVALTLITLNFIGGIINLPEGVIGHEGSTVLVILSGLRLLR